MSRTSQAADSLVQTSAADVRVVRGAPDDVELAALVAGLVAAAGDLPLPEEPLRSTWNDRSRALPGSSSPRSGDTWRWSLRT